MSSIDQAAEEKLNLFLLVRDATDPRLIRVNFDPVLVRLLREAKYFQELGKTVPDSLMRLYQKNDVYYQYTSKLDMMASQYNHIRSAVCEYSVCVYGTNYYTGAPI